MRDIACSVLNLQPHAFLFYFDLVSNVHSSTTAEKSHKLHICTLPSVGRAFVLAANAIYGNRRDHCTALPWITVSGVMTSLVCFGGTSPLSDPLLEEKKSSHQAATCLLHSLSLRRMSQFCFGFGAENSRGKHSPSFWEKNKLSPTEKFSLRLTHQIFCLQHEFSFDCETNREKP